MDFLNGALAAGLMHELAGLGWFIVFNGVIFSFNNFLFLFNADSKQHQQTKKKQQQTTHNH